MSKYLIPCQCGRKLPVETGQAGDLLRCECGATIEAPTLRQLTALEPVWDRDARSGRGGDGPRGDGPPGEGQVGPGPQRRRASEEPSWSPRQGVLFLGVALIVLGAAGALTLFAFRPPNPVTVIQPADATSLTPAEAWKAWHTIEMGLFQGIPVSEAIVIHKLDVDRNNWRQMLIAAEVIATIGVLLTTIGLALALAANRRPRKTPVRAAQR